MFIELHRCEFQIYFRFFGHKFRMRMLHLHLNHYLGVLLLLVVEAKYDVLRVQDEQWRNFIFILNNLAFLEINNFLKTFCISWDIRAGIVIGLRFVHLEQIEILLSSFQQHRSPLHHDEEFQVQISKVFILCLWDAGVELLIDILLLTHIPWEHNFEQVLIFVLVVVTFEFIVIHEH